jgi:hypothetical protein
MEIVKSYNLYLNSRQATSGGTSNNCTFNINPAITLSNRANRFMISIPFLEVPYSFNQLSAKYNTLGYTFTDGAGTFNSTFTIAVGNYNITQAITAFIAAINKSILIQRPSWSLTAISLTYNSSTNYCTFIISAVSTSITLKFSSNYVMGLMFGFPPTDQIFSNLITLTSTQKVLVNPVNAIFLRSDTLKFGSAFEAVVSPYSQADILARVPVPTLPNSWIYYRSEIKQILSNFEIAALNFYWSDNLDEAYFLDLNGLPFGLQVTIDEVQLKPNNEGQDKIAMPTVALPQSLVQERDKVLDDLIATKKRLEKEIEEAKRKKKTETPDRNADTIETPRDERPS